MEPTRTDQPDAKRRQVLRWCGMVAAAAVLGTAASALLAEVMAGVANQLAATDGGDSAVAGE